MAVQVHLTFSFGEFKLEPNSHLLKRGDVSVPLSKKRFEVLLYLLEERHRLVSRQELLERFWDGHEVYEENLTKCISEIRKALDDQKKPHQFIETIPAVGYRYVGPVTEEAQQFSPSVFTVEKTQGVSVVIEEDDNQNSVLVSEKVLRRPLPEEARRGLLSTARIKKPSWLVALLLACALIAITAGAFAIYRSRARTTNSSGAPIRSIAVLPLKNLTGDAANDYLSDGMTESLITALSTVDDLRVMSRSSVFRYKEKDVAPQEVGRQLGIAAVLEGSVRKEGDSVRVAVRLASADDGRVLWASETYGRGIQDLFGLQDAIARNVVSALRVKLNKAGEQRLAQRHTTNPEAYQLYLKGRFYWNQLSAAGLKQSIDYYSLAIEKDPSYALAYSGLADAYVVLGFDYLPPKDVLPKAKEAAMKALALDESLAAAHISMGEVKLFYEWDWDGAKKEADRAKELDPSYARAIELNTDYGDQHHFYCRYLEAIGRADESVREIKRGLEFDPLSTSLGLELGWAYYNSRQYDRAIAASSDTLNKDASFCQAYVLLANAHEQKGMYDEAIAELTKARTLSGEADAGVASELGYAYAASGKRVEALKILQELREQAMREFIDPYNIAVIYLGLGEKDQAFTWFEKAYDVHSTNMIWLDVEPKFDGLRSDRRFKDLLKRIALRS